MFLTFSSAAISQDAPLDFLQLDSSDSIVDPFPYISYLTDDSGTYTIDEISGDLLADFSTPFTETSAFQIESLDEYYWLRIPLENTTSNEISVVIETSNILLEVLSVYNLVNGTWEASVVGNKLSFDERKLNVFTLAIPLTLQPGQQNVFLRIEPALTDIVPLKLYSGDSFLNTNIENNKIAGIFLGIAIGIMLFHFCLYIQIRDLAYLAFSLSILFGIAFRSYYDGTGQWLTGDWLAWNGMAFYLFLGLYMATIFWFHSLYLKLKSTSPLLHKLSMGWAWAYLLTVTVVFALGIDFGRAFELSLVIAPMFLLGSALVRALQGYWPAQVYLAALCLPLLLGFVSALLGFFDILPSTSFAISEQISIVGALMFFSIGLSQRIKILDKEVRAAEERANKAALETKMKSDFLAKMSHEIRTPMNGVMGMSQLLAGTDLDESQRRYNDVIRSSSSTLLQVINDLLDFSKVEAGKLEIESIGYDIREIVTELSEMYQAKSQDTGVEFICEVDDKVPTSLQGDPIRLKQVLMNLINNAFKFTGSGKISLTVNRAPNSTLLVEVRDTGIGIEQENLDHLFQPFNQASASTTREYGGTGLGLSICSELTELMGGKIWARSNGHSGTTFFVQLPLSEEEIHNFGTDADNEKINISKDPESSPSSNHEEEKNLNILVAEDNLVNQMVIKGMLQKMGHSVRIADNGDQALKLAKDKHTNWDMVLMDCEMPVLDGYSASRRIRDFEKTEDKKEVPILALTAHAIGDSEQRCLESGMLAHITKPIQFEELKRAIHQFSRPA